MNRRQFLTTASSATIVAMVPASALTLPASSAPLRKLKWFAVGHDDQFCYPIRAYSMAEAIDEYAHEYGHRKGDYCPECEDVDCKVHLNPTQWDEPHDFIEEYTSEPKEWEGIEAEPSNVQWLRAGFNVRCEGDGCADRSCHWETQECREHDGKALCYECIEATNPTPTNN